APTQLSTLSLHDALPIFGLHPLSVEDALDPHQRDKYVHYEHHVFLVGHDVQLDVEDASLRTVELDVFIGERWLVTVRHGGDELRSEEHTSELQSRSDLVC